MNASFRRCPGVTKFRKKAFHPQPRLARKDCEVIDLMPQLAHKICDERFYSYWVPGLVELIFPDWF